MATYYVDSAAVGANDGTSWTDAWTSITSAVAVAAGSEIRVDDGHSETLAAAFLFTNRVAVLCVDNTASDALSTGANISLNSYSFSLDGYVYGLTFDGGAYDCKVGTNLYNRATFDTCVLDCGTDGTTEIQLHANAFGNIRYTGEVFLLNCTIDYSNQPTTTRYFQFNCPGEYRFKNLTIIGGPAVATAAFVVLATGNNQLGYKIIVEDCDITENPILWTPATSSGVVNVEFRRCKLASTYSYGAIAQASQSLLLEGCDTGTITKTPMMEYQAYLGSVVGDTSVYRTGGASDGDSDYSWKMTSTADATEIYDPFISPPLAVWVDADATPSGATAQGLFQSTRMAPRGTPTALTTDSGSTWNGSGVGTKQKIDVTVGDYTLTVYVASGVTLNNDDFWVEVSAPDQVGGPITVRCFLAVASTTVYVDPRLEWA